MARVTHVKKAQQRYHTKPVIDLVTDEQMEEWREAAVAAAREALDNCPV